MAPDEQALNLAFTNKLLRVALYGVMVITSFWLLLVGQSLLIPLVLAVFVWYLIEALNGFWRRVRIFGKPIPGAIPASLSALVVFFLSYAFLALVASNVAQMTEAAPGYQEKLTRLYEQAIDYFGVDERELTDRVMERFNFGAIVGTIGGALSGLFGNGILIAMYVVFLLLERRFFDAKLRALVADERKRESVRASLVRIDKQVKIYLVVKIFVSLITAVGAYIVMLLVGVDFPQFWAVLIFVFNFIPYIGSTIATLLPTLLALAQFESFTQAVILFVGIQAVQMTVGYVVEPMIMGNTLNISALAVMLSLSFWGLFWGIPGMFLSVPITVVGMIICSNFESSRWVAVLLSKDGSLDGQEESAAASG